MDKNHKKVILLSALGGMFELYDFAIYGVFAIYFVHQFFPETSNHFISVLNTYAVFLLGFILRPIGGIVFSHIGDEIGRKKVLILTIFLMGLSSIAIAMLPTYDILGITAPLLLVFFRMLQGFALGGELPVTFVYIKESIDKNKILAFALVMAGMLSGYLLAAFINVVFTHIIFDELSLQQYAWRIPFLLGGLICLISYKIRKTLRETDAFKHIHNKSRFPLGRVIRYHFPQVILGVFISASQQTLSVIAIIFMPTYFKELLKLSTIDIGDLITEGIILTIIIMLMFGIIFRNYKNISKLFLYGSILNIITVPIAYILMVNKISITGGFFLFMIGHAAIAYIVPNYLTTLFPDKVRLSGVAICYNLSIALLVGVSPMIIMELIKNNVGLIMSPTIYLSSIIIIANLLAIRYANIEK